MLEGRRQSFLADIELNDWLALLFGGGQDGSYSIELSVVPLGQVLDPKILAATSSGCARE